MAVVCLVSALSFHDLTTQNPPVRMFRMTAGAFGEGIETHGLDGVPVRAYSREKTLAACFKYCSRVGLDTAVEAVRRYRDQGRSDVGAMLRAARACRVETVVRPYLEAVQ